MYHVTPIYIIGMNRPDGGGLRKIHGYDCTFLPMGFVKIDLGTCNQFKNFNIYRSLDYRHQV